MAAIIATTHATAILVSTSVPDLRNTVPVARKSMDAPMQKNQTARMGTVPPIIPLVKDPKYSPVLGAKVFNTAPNSNGISIIPPGIRSIVALIFIWHPRLVPPSDGRRD